MISTPYIIHAASMAIDWPRYDMLTIHSKPLPARIGKTGAASIKRAARKARRKQK